MVFSSLVFLLGFLPALLLVYYLVPARFRGLRNLVLLGASLFFYWWGAGPLVLLMVLSISVNYVGGLLAGQRDRPRLAWAGLLFAVCAGLGLLAWFKYAGFLARTICGLGFAVPIPQVTLPIGISFFTFQGLSYVIDVYRGDAPIQKNPLDTALYVALFPQLVAGPIVRYTTVMEEIAHREETLSEFAAGATRFCFGLSKKMVLANSMGQIADGVFGQTAANLDPGLAWVGALAYTFQIYFDFSAYSDMAIGLGHTFGFHFLENFNYPYISRSVTEFWRRWHISLSSWFRDYVYIPLGGQPLLQGQADPQHSDGMAAHRPVARGRLDLHPVGAVVLPPAAGGKIPVGAFPGAAAQPDPLGLYHAGCHPQLGAVPGGGSGPGVGLSGRHVRPDHRPGPGRSSSLLPAPVLAGVDPRPHRLPAGEAVAPVLAGGPGGRRSDARPVGAPGIGPGAAGPLLWAAGHRLLQSLHLFPILRRLPHEKE